MGLELDYSDGQTPLSEEEREGLLIPTVTTRGELDEFEQLNIEQALQWTLSRSFKLETILTEDFICMLHKRMYAAVWDWAGAFRKTNKNFGVDIWQISTDLRYLLDDTMFWHQNNTFPPDEIALRFKHRIVSIHCFPNGNGRHSRLMADIIVKKIYKQPVFTWGFGNLNGEGEIRLAYLRAVKAADKGNYRPLLTFARS